MQYLRLYQGSLPTTKIYQEWEEFAKEQNCGALCIFTGIVRQEESKEIESKNKSLGFCNAGDNPTTHSKVSVDLLNNTDLSQANRTTIVSALSFDVYEPLLHKWFESWQTKATQMGAVLLMAHSVGDVAHTQSSYMCAVISKQRKAALALYEEFIEDFKANAPIWKYDIVGAQRVFALSRSTPIEGSGVLG
ncbi:molybdenum cofactor biosynthesis protein MoaE [uncultured Helicobacter sp.]|uniref:molybdopterin synthase catalytic subunit n=1 Tax=uncultured Helicobacter sp. TaxID=175537 RepID=UPI00374E27AE